MAKIFSQPVLHQLLGPPAATECTIANEVTKYTECPQSHQHSQQWRFLKKNQGGGRVAEVAEYFRNSLVFVERTCFS